MARKVKLDRDIVAVLLVTFYLILYCTLLQFQKSQTFALIMLVFSPVLVVWMVYTVLKHGKYNGPDLGDEEFGYQDKKKDDPGIF